MQKKNIVMNRILILCFLSAYLLLTSCASSGETRMPMSIGSPGEVLIVINDHLWSGATGDSVRHYFTQPAWGLPAPEPMFKLLQVSTLSKFMQKFRSIVSINIDPDLDGPAFRIRQDVYAQNQIVYHLDAPSPDLLFADLEVKYELISTHILLKLRESLIEENTKIAAHQVMQRVREKFAVNIVIPRPYTLEVDEDNFVWIIREERERQWGILIWEEPYECTSQLETDSLIKSMNSVTMQHVPGKIEGSYMATEPLLNPSVRRFEKNDDVYTVQLNGLWQMQNGFMGGPYVNHTIVDTNRGRLVTAVGFVFYPNRDKLQMVRQIEAILHSLTPM